MSSGPDSPSAAKLAETLEDYLASHPAAALLEDGRVLFWMDESNGNFIVYQGHTPIPDVLYVRRKDSDADTWEAYVGQILNIPGIERPMELDKTTEQRMDRVEKALQRMNGQL